MVFVVLMYIYLVCCWNWQRYSLVDFCD